MDRRTFLHRVAPIVVAAAIAPDELLDLLKPRRLYVPGADFPRIVPCDLGGYDVVWQDVYERRMREMLRAGLEALRQNAIMPRLTNRRHTYGYEIVYRNIPTP